MLRVVASHQPPLVFVNEAADGSKNFTGFLVDLLPMLLETAGLPLNYSIRYIPVSALGSSSSSSRLFILVLAFTFKYSSCVFVAAGCRSTAEAGQQGAQLHGTNLSCVLQRRCNDAIQQMHYPYSRCITHAVHHVATRGHACITNRAASFCRPTLHSASKIDPAPAPLPASAPHLFFKPLQAAGGRQLENGSWTGMMGELTSGRADLALYPMTLTAQRAKYIQHTQPFQDGGYGLLVKTQAVNTGEGAGCIA